MADITTKSSDICQFHAKPVVLAHLRNIGNIDTLEFQKNINK